MGFNDQVYSHSLETLPNPPLWSCHTPFIDWAFRSIFHFMQHGDRFRSTAWTVYNTSEIGKDVHQCHDGVNMAKQMSNFDQRSYDDWCGVSSYHPESLFSNSLPTLASEMKGDGKEMKGEPGCSRKVEGPSASNGATAEEWAR